LYFNFIFSHHETTFSMTLEAVGAHSPTYIGYILCHPLKNRKMKRN